MSQVFDPAQPYGFEGTSPQVKVRGEDGVVLDVAPDQPGTALTALLSEPLPAGHYEVPAMQHDCQAACVTGLPDTDSRVVISCNRAFDIEGGETAALLVRIKPTAHPSCVIEDA